MKHLMPDLETMGTGSNAAIISIGAVLFDPNTGETGAEFFCNIDLEDALRCGLSIDANTVMWWMKQSEGARVSLTNNARPLHDALQRFSYFIETHCSTKQLQVWGNGATFDNVILRNAFTTVNLPTPWKFYNDRDVRTLVELGRHLGIDPKKTIKFEGIEHNALSDARHQVRYVSAIWQQIALKKIDKRRKANKGA